MCATKTGRYSESTYRGYVIGDTTVDGDDVVVALRQPLGEEAFEGIEEWSQVWLYYLLQGSEKATTIDYQVMDIVSLEGRKLRLRPIAGTTSAVEGARVIDIKPYHTLDAVL
ncbi:hypothetical protein Pmar_PMAR006834 [Perkinsus marinus ATCC 50983]|uniref:Uncharacterized protein n=1 Tax=Perkinsus marinus (strain ATCC 50983 / TXsc) TaxID=423536 RepID=C5K6L9_PERM5|nr:hypothetical protein Pmar_PMAR006834 [Perkinsus marinus ATCC 50983]EER19939.1 hypothetical protein Pmar_PMAR006834 [Perkinsus marinus ATCC 50983]|eukprot:XP_002788143.1 hypothetical protein Pmar_PMAR006834 [Perkinsus marinus ATCC 50983]